MQEEEDEAAATAGVTDTVVDVVVVVVVGGDAPAVAAARTRVVSSPSLDVIDCKSKPLSTVMPESLSKMTESLVLEVLFLEIDDDESPEAVDLGETLPRFDAIRGTRLVDLLLPVEEDPT